MHYLIKHLYYVVYSTSLYYIRTNATDNTLTQIDN